MKVASYVFNINLVALKEIRKVHIASTLNPFFKGQTQSTHKSQWLHYSSSSVLLMGMAESAIGFPNFYSLSLYSTLCNRGHDKREPLLSGFKPISRFRTWLWIIYCRQTLRTRKSREENLVAQVPSVTKHNLWSSNCFCVEGTHLVFVSFIAASQSSLDTKTVKRDRTTITTKPDVAAGKGVAEIGRNMAAAVVECCPFQNSFIIGSVSFFD